jgi:hypothetical protein
MFSRRERRSVFCAAVSELVSHLQQGAQKEIRQFQVEACERDKPTEIGQIVNPESLFSSTKQRLAPRR